MNPSHPPTAERPLTDRQRVKIFVAARELRLTDEALHELLEEVTGKTSIRVLTKAEASFFIDYLVDGLGASGHRLDFVQSRRPVQDLERPAPGLRPAGDNVIRFATHEQLTKIAYLLRDLDLTWAAPRFLTIAKRATGNSRIRTARDASRVIDALTAITRRQRDCGGEPGPAA